MPLYVYDMMKERRKRMADGSVTIGVVLDTAAFSASVAAVQGELGSLASRIQQSLNGAFSGATIDASLVSAIAGLSQGISAASAGVEQSMLELAVSATTAFVGGGWAVSGVRASTELAAGIASGGGAAISAAQAIAEEAISSFDGGEWSVIGASMMDGIASGIYAAGASVVAAINEVAREAEAAVKSYYDIRSPSALMRDEVGVMISRGIAEGILSGADFVRGAMETVGESAYLGRGSSARSQANAGAVGSVTQNIYLRDSDSSPYRTARRIRRESEAIFRG